VNPHIEAASVTRPLARIEGRLFAEDGYLFLIVHADEATGVARVSCRMDGQTQIIELPLAEVTKRIVSSARLILDNLNGPETAKRIIEQKDGWYFSAREGQMGPFDSRKEAGHKLTKYILSMQTVNGTPREPSRSAQSRRHEAAAA
jgi:hypothetical protein